MCVLARYVCSLDEIFDNCNGLESWWGHVATWQLISVEIEHAPLSSEALSVSRPLNY